MRVFPSSVGLLSLLSCVALGCAQAPPGDVTPEPPRLVQAVSASPTSQPLAHRKFGAAITETSSTPLDGIVRESAKYQSKTVRTEGVVTAVCKSAGCWMEIGDPGGQAHIKMAGHSFFVPKDASGHHAIVQGKVLPTPNDECSEEAKAQTGTVAKLEIEATGVEFVD